MNNFQYARERDSRILSAIEKYRCLDLYQIALMFFPSPKKARKRMLQLYRKKKVKRVRLEIDQPNIYYIDNFDDDTVKLNWVRLYLERKMAYGDTPVSFDYDAQIITYENHLTKSKRQIKITNSRHKLDLGVQVFYADDNKVEEIKEVLLCGQ